MGIEQRAYVQMNRTQIARARSPFSIFQSQVKSKELKFQNSQAARLFQSYPIMTIRKNGLIGDLGKYSLYLDNYSAILEYFHIWLHLIHFN